MKKYLIISCLLVVSLQLYTQTFQVDKLESVSYISLMTALDLTNNYVDRKINQKLTEQDLASLDKDNVWSFDRIAIGKYSSKHKKWSDYAVYFAIGSSLWLTYDSYDLKNNLLVFGEIMITQSAIAKWTKSMVQRKRPYVYDEEVPDEKKFQRNSKHSFFSMHASTAFSAATFGYFYYSKRFGGNIPVAALLYGSAVATGLLRITSGNHYPSDIIVGAIIGSSVSYLICDYHYGDNVNMKLSSKRISISFKF